MFIQDERMRIGAAYYPELWDAEAIDEDIRQMVALGINCVRIGEFAWSSLEKTEGRFTTDWLRDIIRRLHGHQIDTIVCTPSCTPPRWLTSKYPSVLTCDPEGRRAEIHSRAHICKSDPVMREKNDLIIAEMAKAVRGLDGVIGWQIDNELYTAGNGCFCDRCQAGFRQYLKSKYATIDNLNRRLGMSRWSLDFDGFEGVVVPKFRFWEHPSMRMEWLMYQNGLIYNYVSEQAKTIRKYSNRPIGTDTMPNNHLGLYAVTKDLDVMMYNHYEPAGELYESSFFYDFYRPVKARPFWVTETQLAHNGSEKVRNGFHPKGNPYVNTWLPIAKGASMNLYWLFREHRNGHELAHGGVLHTWGRPVFAAQDMSRAAAEINRCSDILLSTRIKSRIAIHFSNTSCLQFEQAPMLDGFNYTDWLKIKIHDAFRHYNVDVIETNKSPDGYDVLFSPFLSCLEEGSMLPDVLDWVSRGGRWIVGPMSGIFDETLTKNVKAPYYHLEELAGVYTDFRLFAEADEFKARWTDGTACQISAPYDAFRAVNPDTKILAAYDGSDFDGLGVVAERKYGRGSIVLLGAVPSQADLLRLADTEPIADASRNLILSERTGNGRYVIAVEVENRAGEITLTSPAKDVLTGQAASGRIEVQPYSVHVFKVNYPPLRL